MCICSDSFSILRKSWLRKRRPIHFGSRANFRHKETRPLNLPNSDANSELAGHNTFSLFPITAFANIYCARTRVSHWTTACRFFSLTVPSSRVSLTPTKVNSMREVFCWWAMWGVSANVRRKGLVEELTYYHFSRMVILLQ